MFTARYRTKLVKEGCVIITVFFHKPTQGVAMPKFTLTVYVQVAASGFNDDSKNLERSGRLDLSANLAVPHSQTPS